VPLIISIKDAYEKIIAYSENQRKYTFPTAERHLFLQNFAKLAEQKLFVLTRGFQKYMVCWSIKFHPV